MTDERRDLPRQIVLAYARQQVARLGEPDPTRCPRCGVPRNITTVDAAGRCRYCRDGEDTPF